MSTYAPSAQTGAAAVELFAQVRSEVEGGQSLAPVFELASAPTKPAGKLPENRSARAAFLLKSAATRDLAYARAARGTLVRIALNSRLSSSYVRAFRHQSIS